MNLPNLLRRLLTRLRFARSPQRVQPRTYGSTVYRSAPVVDKDETVRVPRDIADHIHRGAVNGFPRRGAEPRHRRDVPTGWARVGRRRPRTELPADNQGRFR